MDTRDVDIRVVAEAVAQAIRMLALADVVQFGADRVRELREQRAQVVVLPDLRVMLGQVDDVREDGEILLDLLAHTGSLHLDHDARPVPEFGGMHLADRRRGERRLVEAHEQVLERLMQLRFDDPAHLAERDRWRVILESCQFLEHVRGQQVGARTEHLPELRERGAQFPERQSEMLRLREVVPDRGAQGPRRESPEPALMHDRAEAVRREHMRDAPRPMHDRTPCEPRPVPQRGHVGSSGGGECSHMGVAHSMPWT